MADITMCKGQMCHLKESCYRYKATPNEYMQYYFTFAPISMLTGKCKDYWEVENGSNK